MVEFLPENKDLGVKKNWCDTGLDLRPSDKLFLWYADKRLYVDVLQSLSFFPYLSPFLLKVKIKQVYSKVIPPAASFSPLSWSKICSCSFYQVELGFTVSSLTGKTCCSLVLDPTRRGCFRDEFKHFKEDLTGLACVLQWSRCARISLPTDAEHPVTQKNQHMVFKAWLGWHSVICESLN